MRQELCGVLKAYKLVSAELRACTSARGQLTIVDVISGQLSLRGYEVPGPADEARHIPSGRRHRRGRPEISLRQRDFPSSETITRAGDVQISRVRFNISNRLSVSIAGRGGALRPRKHIISRFRRNPVKADRAFDRQHQEGVRRPRDDLSSDITGALLTMSFDRCPRGRCAGVAGAVNRLLRHYAYFGGPRIPLGKSPSAPRPSQHRIDHGMMSPVPGMEPLGASARRVRLCRFISHGDLCRRPVCLTVERGSDELLSQSGVTVMAPAAPHHADNNNQDSAAKKIRLFLNGRTLTSPTIPYRNIHDLDESLARGLRSLSNKSPYTGDARARRVAKISASDPYRAGARPAAIYIRRALFNALCAAARKQNSLFARRPLN
ncbi:hypothetical protein EVAR_44066_1 [Eumeta japonica]|uniref:Uncharacterized protein n=1 Tax=Eumeta variegata TaxID=151549 RepID=A0A4C1X2C3_EUMVA|nr:hypothetical protein EVAR_44066_1 [Eumeta japonica]